jgi:hypothetical protein
MRIYKRQIDDNFKNAVDMEFYTFYLELNKSGTSFQTDTGILKVKVTKQYLSEYGTTEHDFELLEVSKQPILYFVKIEKVINKCIDWFYTSYEEAVLDYDNLIKHATLNPKCTPKNLEDLYFKLINPINEEEKALLWYGALPSIHKNHLRVLGLDLKEFIK